MRPAIIALALLSLAASYTDAEAIHAIAGEARGEPFAGQVAIGEAIRNRGTLRGVYGLNVPVSKFSESELKTAARAWRDSERSTLTGGAVGWGSESDWEKFRKYKWFSSTVETVQIGGHRFWKLKTGGSR